MRTRFFTNIKRQFIFIIGVIAALFFLFIVVCGFQMPFLICIHTEKKVVLVKEDVVVQNCGDEVPPIIEASIDWGDGSKATNGQSGKHQYEKPGKYVIKLLGNGEPVSEKVGTTENVEIVIEVKQD